MTTCGCHECALHPIKPVKSLAPLERQVRTRLLMGWSPYGPDKSRRRYDSAALRRMHYKGLAGWEPGGPWFLTTAGIEAP